MNFNYLQTGTSAHVDIDAICPRSKPFVPDYSGLYELLHHVIQSNVYINDIQNYEK